MTRCESSRCDRAWSAGMIDPSSMTSRVTRCWMATEVSWSWVDDRVRVVWRISARFVYVRRGVGRRQVNWVVRRWSSAVKRSGRGSSWSCWRCRCCFFGLIGLQAPTIWVSRLTLCIADENGSRARSTEMFVFSFRVRWDKYARSLNGSRTFRAWSRRRRLWTCMFWAW